MKKKINCSWPAKLMDFSQDSKQENFSRGKLKVFYKGETEDKRYFSDDFAKVLIETLPYTPVVSYYNEEEYKKLVEYRDMLIGIKKNTICCIFNLGLSIERLSCVKTSC